MRIFIFCTLFALAWSRPQEPANGTAHGMANGTAPENQHDQDDPNRGRLVGIETICPNIRPYPNRDHNGFTRFRFCWDDPGWENDKRMSEDAARAWERVSNMTMEFLNNCNNRDAGVTPIYIRDTRPFVMQSYENCKFKATQVVLNFQLSPVSGYGWCNSSPVIRNDCIKFLAMHEMGHAIGFRHEQDHPSSTCNMDRNYGAFNVETRFDTESIMNYCYTASWNNPHLSPLDIEGVQRVYGRRMQLG